MKHFIFYTSVAVLSIVGMNTTKAQSTNIDTQWHVTLATVNVTAERTWANDTARYRYNQMKYYVTTVMPYVNEAVKLQQELNAKINSEGISKKERKAFIKMREEALKERFDAEVKKLNETQGVLMVKLIARQTGVNIYDMLSEYKNPLAATKWLAWGRINGFNINKQYDPYNEPMLESIMENLDYPLPSFYQERVILSSK